MKKTLNHLISKKTAPFLLLFVSVVTGYFFSYNFSGGETEWQASSQVPIESKLELYKTEDIYADRVQKIFNQRCIACHSCMDSPCQLNLQSYEGLTRGAHQTLVYNGGRLSATEPTRLFEDAHSTAEWREKGFIDVISKENPILLTLINLGNDFNSRRVRTEKEEQICPRKIEKYFKEKDFERLAMPYGLPKLKTEEIQTLAEWISSGAPGPQKNLNNISKKNLPLVKKWEEFLNASDVKSRVTARYLYEHLFLAHIYFDPSDREFFKIVRSKNKCSDKVEVINTRRPNEDPGVELWYYCLIKDHQTVVYKNHIPYEFSDKKLNWFKKIFLNSKWNSAKIEFPSFSEEIAANPFKAFKDMPVDSRYQFLLNDAQYHVMTFIKGPVCNGTQAVNSIQEQFYAFFIDPKSNLTTLNTEYANKMQDQLILPGDFGSDVEITKILSNYSLMLEKRNQYRFLRAEQLKKYRPNGLTLNDVWDGGGWNDNAFLTIFRHDDNSKVYKGAVGDLSKTVFVLDYPLFERLVYNLVVNFDVFGNVGHQALTRLYMDFLRMESENNFLDFLKPEHRVALKSEWYKGTLTKFKLNLFAEKQFPNIPSGLQLSGSPNEAKRDLIQKVLFERLNEKVRGPIDPINWKFTSNIQKVQSQVEVAKSEKLEIKLLSEIAGVKNKWNEFFPEVTFVVVTHNNQFSEGYSIARNREKENASWILFESLRATPEDDTLVIKRGYMSAYPNLILKVERSQLPQMISDIKKMEWYSDFINFREKYIVDRMNPYFWNYYDYINQDLLKIEPLEAGYIDLSRLYSSEN